jgi:hypothetical protein
MLRVTPTIRTRAETKMKRKYWTTAGRDLRECPNLDKGEMMRNYLFFILVVMGTSCASLSDNTNSVNEEQWSVASKEPKFVDVDLCDVLNQPAEFDGMGIRTTAILLAGFESAFAYDPKCVSDDRLVWFEIKSDSVSEQIKPYFVPETEEFRTKGLNRMKGRFVGIFETKKEKGFGHLNSANYKLTITSASDLRFVEPDVPYPW